MAILGIDSTTPFKRMSGHITPLQLRYIKEFFAKQSADTAKIIVMHHNLIHSQKYKVVNNTKKIINHFAACNVNIILSGHIHSPKIELLSKTSLSENMYAVTAGTATSTKTFLPKFFNLICLEKTEFKLIVKEFTDDAYVTKKEGVFQVC